MTSCYYCGHGRRDHLHGNGMCMAIGCDCRVFYEDDGA